MVLRTKSRMGPLLVALRVSAGRHGATPGASRRSRGGLPQLAFLLLASLALAQPADPKFDAIKAKRERGEPLTAEERDYGQSVLAQRNKAQFARKNTDFAQKNPPRSSTGLLPLTDLAAGTHHGEAGGLYPDGNNTPPPAHAADGLKLARAIAPLGPDGKPAPDGRIVLLSVGMSNATQEFSAFQRLAAADAALNPRLVLVDGAQGGQTAAVTAKADANYWTVTEQRLKAAGVSSAQVQVVWIKQANEGPTQPFPAATKKLQANIAQTLRNLTAKFPNLKIAYLSSRTYGGYAATPLNPEPHAYETAFAVKWLIADQIAGKNSISPSPWLAWGPYLWTDGTKGRADGFTWTRDDCAADGTHPSDAGRRKVAELLLKFFKSEPTAQPWLLR